VHQYSTCQWRRMAMGCYTIMTDCNTTTSKVASLVLSSYTQVLDNPTLSWWHIGHFLAPVSGARNKRQLSGARKHDTLSWHIIPAACQLRFCLRFYHNRFLMMHYAEIRFFHTVLSVEKHFRHCTSSFILVYKQTSRAIVCSDWPITVQLSRRFPAQNWTCCIRRWFLAP